MVSAVKTIGVLLGVLGLVNANSDVMETVIRSQEKLERLGFFQQGRSHGSVVGKPRICWGDHVDIDGEAFPCDNIHFLSFLNHSALEVPGVHADRGHRSADIWGWNSPFTGKEFTILSQDNGVVFIDSTDPIFPCIVAKMPTKRNADVWADVKVYENTVYYVQDTIYGDSHPLGNNETGIQILDLRKLDYMRCPRKISSVPIIEPDNVIAPHGYSHNVAVNTESGRLYSVGTRRCRGGPLIFDLNEDPLNPVEIGCVSEDNYTHDIQCITYDGPDEKYHDREICFAFNEDTLTIFDVTDAANPIMVSRNPYSNQAYSHQGWVNDDLTLVLLDDELDESCNKNMSNSRRCPLGDLSGQTPFTTTKAFDITSLESPIYKGEYLHPEQSIDHNLYVWGTIHRKGWGGNKAIKRHPDPNFAYMNNYLAGLKVVDIHSNDLNDWTEVGTFDIAPDRTEVEFAGIWSGYMFPSGVYAASSIERGVFFLYPGMAFTKDYPKYTFFGFPIVPTLPFNARARVMAESVGVDPDSNTTLVVLASVFSVVLIGSVLGVVKLVKRRSKSVEHKSAQETNTLEVRV